MGPGNVLEKAVLRFSGGEPESAGLALTKVDRTHDGWTLRDLSPTSKSLKEAGEFRVLFANGSKIHIWNTSK